MPSYPLVFQLVKEWLLEIARGNLAQVLVYFTSFQGPMKREPAVFQLLPFQIELTSTTEQAAWPPPIVETDPEQLFLRMYEQSTALRLYEALLHTKASIHSTRYQLMEDSTKNADRLIEDLTIMLQMERRQSITREMQELAIGAGLLRK
jgi:ATP synthase F1 gamma subunit